ncbi:hypothetical protein D0T53_00055 [Dysgonomonas sp. 216]|uniref:hypothetical protein n=1 Tax=Dysgonomonas sp. 216 TaxID=2302934 RepID=UPI0013D501DF|nr:hypothetical protein [Dysgonomonas sp. 216]NDW17305.1 hypothetical protein [Dysgonomonas sp. 216]
MKKVALLGIDLQNDFTDPKGALYVDGSENDIKHIAEFIQKNGKLISYIALSFDSHQPIHIASQCYWKDENGKQPDLYSTIKAEDVAGGKWIAQYNKHKALTYLQLLEAKGQTCTIWPPHCIIGGWGWAINQQLVNVLYDWSLENGRYYEPFYKGYNQSTEHYSIFKAAVSYENSPETKLNKKLLSKLNLFDEVIIVGEAADYCVANSLDDLIEHAPKLTSKIVMFNDCMSWINSDNAEAKAIFDKAVKAGVRFEKSIDYKI